MHKKKILCPLCNGVLKTIEEKTNKIDWPAHAHAHGQIVHVWNETETFSYQLIFF